MSPPRGARDQAMLYAVFSYDTRYHLTLSDSSRTLCGLPTKGSRAGEAERTPPAQVRTQAPPASLYAPCRECYAERAAPCRPKLSRAAPA